MFSSLVFIILLVVMHTMARQHRSMIPMKMAHMEDSRMLYSSASDLCVRVRVCVRACVCVCVCVSVMGTHTHTHTSMHTYIHTHH